MRLDGRELKGWETYSPPMNDPASVPFSKITTRAPALYRGAFNLEQPGDTFLDVSKLRMGVAWVNGHNLGRFWNIGPQQTLYVPGVWLKKGRNELIIFDLQDDLGAPLAGRREPILNQLGAARKE